jgi:hypothetical protein
MAPPFGDGAATATLAQAGAQASMATPRPANHPEVRRFRIFRRSSHANMSRR